MYLNPMDWVLERTVHKGFLGASFGTEVFTDLDYVFDVALLAEMLSVTGAGFGGYARGSSPLWSGDQLESDP